MQNAVSAKKDCMTETVMHIGATVQDCNKAYEEIELKLFGLEPVATPSLMNAPMPCPPNIDMMVRDIDNMLNDLREHLFRVAGRL
jgi:hypothetical protein